MKAKAKSLISPIPTCMIMKMLRTMKLKIRFKVGPVPDMTKNTPVNNAINFR